MALKGTGGTWKLARRMLNIPAGAGILFGARARRRLVLAVVGSVLIAAIEVASVTAVLPLMQLLTGTPATEGAPGRIARLLGVTEPSTLAIVLALGVLCGFLIKGLVSLAFKWWLMGVMLRQQVDTSKEILSYFLKGPYSLHAQRPTGELIRNCTEAVSRVYTTVALGSINIITEAVTVAAVVILLVVVMPLPTILLVAYFGVAAFAFARITQPRLKRNGEVVHAASVDVFSAAVNALGGVKEIKLRGNYSFFLMRFIAARTRIAEAERRSLFLTELPRYVMEILFILGLGGMVAIIFATRPTDSALGVVALFAAAGYRTMPSVVRLLATFGMMRSSDRALMDVVDDVRSAHQWVNLSEDQREPTSLDQQLSLNDVSFFYPSSTTPVLRNVSFRVPSGSSVALVGGSGAGKSTIVDLILGMQTPSSGSIEVDGTDISKNLSGWRAGIGLVPQEVWFTDGTLGENIAFGVEAQDVDPDALADAVDQADLAEFLAESSSRPRY